MNLKRIPALLAGLAVRAWNHLDPKLKYTVLSAAVAWVVTKYAIQLDPTLSAVVAGVIGSATGYQAPNDASLLRASHADGNAEAPAEAREVPAGTEQKPGPKPKPKDVRKPTKPAAPRRKRSG
jgi:hypothetical protein